MIVKGNLSFLDHVLLEITQFVTFRELIKETIPALNKLLEKKNVAYRLTTDNMDDFQLKASKKSGKPDTDLPGKCQIMISNEQRFGNY